MNSQEIRALQEAYNQVHQVDENLLRSLDTGARNLAGAVGGNIGAREGREKMGNLPVLGDIGARQGRTQGTQRGQQMYDKAKETVGGLLKQDYEYDMFDVILEYLVAEGYADTNESALVIMANMSEDWRESICESLLDTVASGAGSVVGTVQRAAREVPKYVQQKVNNVAGTYEYARQRADANAPSGAKMSVPTKPSTPRSREFSHGGKSGMTNPGPNFGR